MVVERTRSYYIFEIIFVAIEALVAIIICFYHLITTIIHTRKRLKKQIKKEKEINLHYYFSTVAHVLGCLTIFAALNKLTNRERCDTLMAMGPACYVFFKMFIYLSLIGWLWVLFTGSFRQFYSKKSLQIYSLISVALHIAFTVYIYIGIRFVYDTSDGMPYCKLIVPQPDYGSIMLCFLDIVIGIINIVLFSKPLYAMYRLHKKVNYKIVIIRAWIASILAHLTTILALVVIFLGAPIPVMVSADCILSSVCVIAIYEWNWYCTNWMIPNWREYEQSRKDRRKKMVKVNEKRPAPVRESVVLQMGMETAMSNSSVPTVVNKEGTCAKTAEAEEEEEKK